MWAISMILFYAGSKGLFYHKILLGVTDTKPNPTIGSGLITYPQDYGWSTDPAIPEQIVVSTAQHPTVLRVRVIKWCGNLQ